MRDFRNSGGRYQPNPSSGHQPPESSGRRKKEREKAHGNGAVYMITVLLIAALTAVVAIALYSRFGGKKADSGKTKKPTEGSASDLMDSGTGTENLVLFGENSAKENGAGNYVMLLHVDYDKKTAKMVTVYRDTLMQIPDKGAGRVVDAYTEGGPELLVKTLDQNLDLDFENYAVVHFTDTDSIETLYDAAMKHDEKTVASMANDMLSDVDTNTSTEHVRKWINAMGTFDLTTAAAEPNSFYGGPVQGVSDPYVLVPLSLTDMAERIHAFLLGDSYTPGKAVQSLSEEWEALNLPANNALPGDAENE